MLMQSVAEVVRVDRGVERLKKGDIQRHHLKTASVNSQHELSES